MTFDVLDGGMATTVQDAGRPAWTHLGVPVSGAADPWSLAVANLLVGGEATAAALEMTLVGPRLVARRSMVIGLAGADLGGRVVGGRRLEPGRSHRIDAGDTIAFAGDRPDWQGRAYLALAGGIDVAEVLGSRSTCLAAGFGGVAGRALRAGDVIGPSDAVPGAGSPAAAGGRAWPGARDDETLDVTRILRIIGGPSPGIEMLTAGSWRVGADADRVGLRLDGGTLPDGIAGETISRGVPWGAIQVPPDGRPIVLGVDHQTTGGYRVLGVVVSADRPILGQLRPGAAIRFVAIERAAAVEALRARQALLAAGAAALREAVAWDDLARSAGG